MKMALLCSIFLSFSLYASELPKRLTYLNRVINLESKDKSTLIQLRFKEIKDDKIIYSGEFQLDRSLGYGDPIEGELYLKNKNVLMNIIIDGYPNVQHLKFDFGTYPKLGSDVQSQTLDGEIKFTNLTLQNAMFTKVTDQRILQNFKMTGPLYFDPCDGCEHGDQLMIENENKNEPIYRRINMIAAIDLGDFYYSDCPGLLHPWIQSLEELEVPFTYVGTINVKVNDYWDLDSFWESNSGKLYIGYTEKIELIPFLDTVVETLYEGANRTASPEIIRANLKISKKEDKLIFRFLYNQLIINLKTGEKTFTN